MSKSTYSDAFYENRHSSTAYAAGVVLDLAKVVVPRFASVVDIGCGVGTWLSVARRLGATEIQGVDGPWVDKRLLEIDVAEFKQQRLQEPFDLQRRFDLAISLEVAEHLPADESENFVRKLTSLSDFVLFSAAIPYQGGSGHVTERWPAYWCAWFDRMNYRSFDPFRKTIWGDDGIPVWYRQNLLLFANEARVSELRLGHDETSGLPLALVHPSAYMKKLEMTQSVGGCLRLLVRAVKNSIRVR